MRSRSASKERLSRARHAARRAACRSISEFGAVVILAYYPMTAPVKIYELFLQFGVDQAASASVRLEPDKVGVQRLDLSQMVHS
jgi:hypothetical protein